MKFVPKFQINNTPALVQIMAWRRPGDKPLSGTMMVSLLTYICVAQPQWVKPHNGTVSLPRYHGVGDENLSVMRKPLGAWPTYLPLFVLCHIYNAKIYDIWSVINGNWKDKIIDDGLALLYLRQYTSWWLRCSWSSADMHLEHCLSVLLQLYLHSCLVNHLASMDWTKTHSKMRWETWFWNLVYHIAEVWRYNPRN